MSATVTKLEKNRFLVTGVIVVIGGKRVDEPYRRLHATKAKAERDAVLLDSQNADAIIELAADRQRRLENAHEYLVARAARPVSAIQLSLFLRIV